MCSMRIENKRHRNNMNSKERTTQPLEKELSIANVVTPEKERATSSYKTPEKEIPSTPEKEPTSSTPESIGPKCHNN